MEHFDLKAKLERAWKWFAIVSKLTLFARLKKKINQELIRLNIIHHSWWLVHPQHKKQFCKQFKHAIQYFQCQSEGLVQFLAVRHVLTLALSKSWSRTTKHENDAKAEKKLLLNTNNGQSCKSIKSLFQPRKVEMDSFR